VGTDANARAVALTTGRADATLLTAPAYFPLEKQGYKTIANMADFNDIYASTVYLFTRKTMTANPKLAESIIKAHAEAIKRFYEDKAFAIKAYGSNATNAGTLDASTTCSQNQSARARAFSEPAIRRLWIKQTGSSNQLKILTHIVVDNSVGSSGERRILRERLRSHALGETGEEIEGGYR
jgi:hypothetical protein